jgi:hypothetical protein
VAVANDPVNQGRGLLLLQKAGLIKLKDGVGFKATLDDIVENPKNLKFSEVEGPQLVRVTPDVDLAMGYPNFIAVSKAFDPGWAFSIRASKTSNSQSPSSPRRRNLTIQRSRNWSPFTRTRTPSKPRSPKDLATIQSSTRCPGGVDDAG